MKKQKRKKYFLSALSFFVAIGSWCLLSVNSVQAAEYDVGGGNNNYATVNALFLSVTLQSGDIVNIYPGIYYETWDISDSNDGNVFAPIIIRGVDDEGNPIDSPQETAIFDLNGRKEIDIYGDNITIQGLCFRNASDVAFQSNSANTILKYNLFKSNHNSFQTKLGSQNIIVEYCEFDGSGKLSDSHDIYGLHATKLTIRFCYFHDAPSPIYNVIKSRDFEVHILYNYIEMGVAPYAIDLPHQGDVPGVENQHAYIIGNIVERTLSGDEGGFAFVKYNQEEYARNGNVIIINNTFIDKTGSMGAVFSMKLEDGYIWEISNNIFLGISDLTRDETHVGDLVGYNNVLPSEISPDGLSNSIYSSLPGLNFDYRPLEGSVVRDAGYSQISILPEYSYDVSTNSAEARVVIGETIDIGAFEYVSTSETCTDNIQNQDETGIDCGGVCEACAVPTTYGLSNFISAITNWLGIGNATSDVNSDGVVNTRDLGVMMSNWE